MSDDTNRLGFFPSSEDDERHVLARRVAREWLKEQEAVRETPHEQWNAETWREILTALIERQIHLMAGLEVAHSVGREMFDKLKLKDREGPRRVQGRADVVAREHVRGFVQAEHEGYESHLQLRQDLLAKDGPHRKFSDEKVLEWIRDAWRGEGRKVRKGRPRRKTAD